MLESVDYGVGYPLGRAETESEARALLLAYVARPLPAVQPISRADLDLLVGRVARHYFDLRDRVRAAGDAGLAITLPPELPVDRVGASGRHRGLSGGDTVRAARPRTVVAAPGERRTHLRHRH